MRNNLWQPVWTRLPEASKACSELLKCGCENDVPTIVANA